MNSLTRFAAVTVVASIIAACGAPPQTPAVDQNEAFAAYAVDLIDRFLDRNPEWAIYSGRYDNAGELTVPDAERRAADLAWLDAELVRLGEFDPAALDASNRTDYELIRNELEGSRWSMLEFKGGEWMPSQYNVAGPIALLLNTDYAPLDERLRAVLARLERVPAYYEAARANVKDPTPEHTALAVLQANGTLSVLGDELLARVESSGLGDDEKADFARRVAGARDAVNGWVAWLETLEPTRSFRIGEALYEQKFKYDIQSTYSARGLYERALEEKAKLHATMDEITVELWPKYFPDTAMPDDRLERIGQLIDHLAARHVERDAFFGEIQRQIPELAAFV